MLVSGIMRISLVLSALMASAIAAENSADVKLESIKISAEALQDRSVKSRISAEDIERTQAKDVKDIFANDTSISVGGGGKNAQRLYVRGIEASNLNVTIDGAKQGRALFRHRGDIQSIDPVLLKQVEVSTLSGAESGSGALAGSIVFETVDAQDLLTEGQKVGAILRAGYMGASRGHREGVSLYGSLHENLGLLLDASAQNQNDYRGGSGEKALYTAAKDYSYLAKLSLLDHYDHSLRISASRHHNTGHYITGGPGSDMGAPKPNQVANFQRLQRDSYTLRHRYNPENPLVDLSTQLYYNKQNLENKSSAIDVTSEGIGGSLKNAFRFEVGTLKNRLALGIDHDSDTGKSPSSVNKSIGVQSNRSTNTGLFLQGDTSWQKATIHYGARWDKYSSEFGPKEISGNELSPNFGASYEIIPGLSVLANYSEAVRAGGILPLQWMANITPKTNFNDGKAFKPEQSKQKEFGVKYAARGIFADQDRVRLSAMVFETTMENLIELAEGGRGLVRKIWNAPHKVISKGYELKASWEVDRFFTSLGFSHVDTEDEDGKPLEATRLKSASSGDKFTWSLGYEVSPTWSVGYTLRAVGKLDDIPASSRAGYALHDINMQWKSASLQGLNYQLAVKNLFDKSYSDQSSFDFRDVAMEEPGRDIRFSVQYKF